MPRSVPNYLTINPATGEVGAAFTGHVAASGIDFSSVPYPNPVDEIRWTRKSDGAFLASIYNDSLQDINFDTPHSSLTLSDDVGGPNVQSSLRAFIGGNHAGGPRFINILDSDGNSTFLKWDSVTSNQTKIRQVSFTFSALPAGGEANVTIALPWSTLLTVIGGFNGAAPGNAGPQLCTWGWTSGGVGSFNVTVRNNSPFGMGAGGAFIGMAIYA